MTPALWVFAAGVVVPTLGLIGYDVWLYATSAPTLSEQLLDLARKAPIVAFAVGLAVGVLAGHLFWPQ